MKQGNLPAPLTSLRVNPAETVIDVQNVLTLRRFSRWDHYVADRGRLQRNPHGRMTGEQIYLKLVFF